MWRRPEGLYSVFYNPLWVTGKGKGWVLKPVNNWWSVFSTRSRVCHHNVSTFLPLSLLALPSGRSTQNHILHFHILCKWQYLCGLKRLYHKIWLGWLLYGLVMGTKTDKPVHFLLGYSRLLSSLINMVLTVHCMEKSQLCIPFLGIARPHSRFPHSCVCERFIYSQDWSTYLAIAK